MTTRYAGLDPDELSTVLHSGTDHAGAPVVPFVADGERWPLRCCLADSMPGETLAIIGFSPFPPGWVSPYRTCGPVVVHAEGCAGSTGELPPAFEERNQLLRAYGRDDGRERTLVYDLGRLVLAGEGLARTVEQMLEDDRVDFVHSANVRPGCYSFTAFRD